MKHIHILIYFTITVLITEAHSQNQYIDTVDPGTMSNGVYYQSGPGGSNSSYNWEYPYGTKLTVNAGSIYRNFEITTTGYPFGNLKLRQWDNTSNNWTVWRSILLSDGNGNVGVGISSSPSKFHVFNGASGGTPHSFSDLTVEDNDNGMISILTPSNRVAYYGFADENDSYVGGMQYDHANDKMVFRVNNHESDMVINSNGNLGLGTTTPDAKLTVKGNIHTNEVKVDLLDAVAPDYVFYKDYDLKSLKAVENYIASNGHLPNIPSAKDMETEGIKLKELNLKLLEKIEELTLYAIEQEKKIIEQKEKLENQEIINNNLQETLKLQETRIQVIETLLNSKTNKL